MRRVFIPVVASAAVLLSLFAVSCGGSGLPGPGSVIFTDTDMGSGEIGGTVTIERSTDESAVTRYVIYWGSSANQKLEGENALGEAELTGADEISIVIPQDTSLPAGATHILAFAQGGDEESETFEAAEIEDRGSTVTVTLNHSLTEIAAFDMTVSGSDMDDVTATGDGTTTDFVVEVADGASRTFEVTAVVSDTSVTTAIAFSGSVTETLTAGEATAITVPIDTLAQTKIAAPDYLNNRLVEIEDMNGTGWTELTYAEIGQELAGFTSEDDFVPSDVDYDSQGRIYVANYTSNRALKGIVRFDDITGAGAYEIPNTLIRSRCIAVDRLNGTLYYVADLGESALYMCNLDGTEHQELDIISDPSLISGLAVDDEGILYLSCNGTRTSDVIVCRYNPVTETVDKSYENADISGGYDVIVKVDSVYVTNPYGDDGEMILQLDEDLNLTTAFGSRAADQDNPGDKEFLGPFRFVAFINDGFTITDENTFTENYIDRLIHFDDNTGNGWTEYNNESSDFSFFTEFSMPAEEVM